MKVYFNIKNNQELKSVSYSKATINIALSEMEYVDIEVELSEYVNPNKVRLILGNTSIQLDEPDEVNSSFLYHANLAYLSSILPGKDEAHLSEAWYPTKSNTRRFSRLFINEIGLCKIFVLVNDEEFHVANILVETSKISSEDYELITLYLISEGYFDSNIIYKSVLEGSQDDIKNTLLEALRELLKKLEDFSRQVTLFRSDPITRYSHAQSIVKNNGNQALDDASLDWLVENVHVIKSVGPKNIEFDFHINGTPAKVEEILVSDISKNFDSYENRIIHGFLKTLKYLLINFSEQIRLQNPRTRIDNFRDFLVSCFNNLITVIIADSKRHVETISTFFQKHIVVSSPIQGFPTRTEGFLRKRHYRNILDLIEYSRKLFNVNINLNKFSLEIESFDKLFEIYCFYLLKDTFRNLYPTSDWAFYPQVSNVNKLSGRHVLDSSNISISIYYESLPSEFRQFTKVNYNPDFIVCFSKSGNNQYVIFDAKYKNYNSNRLAEDLTKLTMNYLHKIGLADQSSKVLGLFTISLSGSNQNRISTVFKTQYGINSQTNEMIIPQIGNIELTPKTMSIQTNPLITVIQKLLY